jgi:hypothetical protein
MIPAPVLSRAACGTAGGARRAAAPAPERGLGDPPTLEMPPGWEAPSIQTRRIASPRTVSTPCARSHGASRQTPLGGAGSAATASTPAGGRGLASPAVRDRGDSRTAGPTYGSARAHLAVLAPRSGQSRRSGGCFNSPAGPLPRRPRRHGGHGRANQLRVPAPGSTTCAGTRPITAAWPSSGEGTARLRVPAAPQTAWTCTICLRAYTGPHCPHCGRW